MLMHTLQFLKDLKVKKLKDIVELKQGGTSYSGGGEAVVSTKYKTGVR